MGQRISIPGSSISTKARLVIPEPFEVPRIRILVESTLEKDLICEINSLMNAMSARSEGSSVIFHDFS